MARSKKIKQIEDKPTSLEEPVNTNVELFYNTRPVFFSHNSIDQIHPLHLDTYFTWNKLPKVALNWINQTEATINLSIDAITQFKLTNWFHFGDVYFNVMAYKMISQTGNNKVYQYHLKMNIHNTFLPKIFREFQTTNYRDYLVNVRRTNNLISSHGNFATKKIDPILDFKNKNYCLVSSCVDYNATFGLPIFADITNPDASKEMPSLQRDFSNSNFLYFIYNDNDNTSGGISYYPERRYKTIKWYVWKNPRTRTYILVPSIGDRFVEQRAMIVKRTSSQRNVAINRVINVATGKWKDQSISEKGVFNCANSDKFIEDNLLNRSANDTEFGNQDNFVGAFFGPAITGGQWHLYKPLNAGNINFLCVVLDNNLDIFNGDGSYFWYDKFNILNYKSTKIYTSLRLTYTSDTINLTNNVHRFNNTSTSDFEKLWSYWIISNLHVQLHSYKVLNLDFDTKILSLIPLTHLQISNNIVGNNPSFITPYQNFSFTYPQTNTVITDAYQQYLNSVRNSQDTSLAIARQNMEVNIAQHTVNGVIGSARGIATAATNWFNPSKIASGSLDTAQAVADTAFGISREVIGYQNKQKEIDAANMDKKNSVGATMHASTVNDGIQNMYYGRGAGLYEYYVFYNEQTDRTKCKLPLMYWTSVLGHLPTASLDIQSYNNYLYWNGIYLDEKYNIGSLNSLWYGNFDLDHLNPGFFYVDMDIEPALLDTIYGNLNNDYKLMVHTIFGNGLRLFIGGYTPTNLKADYYQPGVVG